MRRALAILKYVPAVLFGLLVVAWVTSWIFRIESDLSIGGWNGKVKLFDSTIEVVHLRRGKPQFQISAEWNSSDFALRRLFGWLASWQLSHGFDYDQLPIPVLISLVLPAAIGCLTRFRFPLWSYFAWTALVAAELAYYLRT